MVCKSLQILYPTETLQYFSSFKREGMQSFWLLYTLKAVNGYCVTKLASIFFPPSAHSPYGLHAHQTQAP